MTTNCNHPNESLIETENGNMMVAGGDLIEPETRIVCTECGRDVTDEVHQRDLDEIGRQDREAQAELEAWMDEETRNPTPTDFPTWDGDTLFDNQDNGESI